MEGTPLAHGRVEKTYEPFLLQLWEEYDFMGRPPFSGSEAEKRLKELCDKYAGFIDHNKNQLPGDEAMIYGSKKLSSSDSARRALHNQIALMVVGEQRSGMESRLARNIAEFAYEYSKGYKIGEAEKYGK